MSVISLQDFQNFSSEPVWPPVPGSGRDLRVLFLNPPSIPYNQVVKGLAHRHTELSQTIAMPMGILYLAAVLERSLPGIDIRVVDLSKAYRDYSRRPDRRELTLHEFAALTLREQLPDDFVPDLVGASILFSTAHRSVGHITAAAKERWPHVPVVVGGMHATNAVESLLEFPSIDYVCRGEAESLVTDLVLAAREKRDAETLPGIIGRGKLARRAALAEKGPLESAPLVHDLDTIPFPAWHLIPMSEYVHGEGSRARALETITQDEVATLVTTRGCPFHCAFCSSWTVHGREMRYRSVENVIEELVQLRERFGVTTVVPEDDLFSVKKPRILALCKAVSETFGRSLQFQFPNGLSVATLDEDVIRAMALMGMTVANIAIESGSAYVQRHIIKKNCNLDRARKVVQACRDTGIIVRAYFILGFPGETRDHMQETIDFAASLPTDWSVFNIAAPLIGTEMYEKLIERGDIDRSFNWDDAFFHERTFDTVEIGAQELKDLGYAANLRINFFGNYNLRHGHYERAIHLFQNILGTYKGHLAAQYCIALACKGLGDDARYRRAIDECHAMLLPGRDPLAGILFDQFRDLFPELRPIDPPVPEMALVGPRPGMPTAARQSV